MTLTRRSMMALGGGSLVFLAAARLTVAAGPLLVEMRGTARGERVWFTPVGLALEPGTTVRFVNRDRVNSHTATAYHPDNFGRPLRIPPEAGPWDSGFLLPNETFEVTLHQPGVYDFYCIPHEMAGMAGRFVVGRPTDAGWVGAAGSSGDLPEAALRAFPDVGDILAAGRIEPEQGP